MTSPPTRRSAPRLTLAALLPLLAFACRGRNPEYAGLVELPDAGSPADDAPTGDDAPGTGLGSDGLRPDAGRPDGLAPSVCLPWGLAGAHTRRPLAAAEPHAAAGSWASHTFDHAGLVAAGRSLGSGADVRVLRWEGERWTEVERFLDDGSAWNTSASTLRFWIPPGSLAAKHYLHFGDLAARPPADERPRAVLERIQRGTTTLSPAGARRPIALSQPAPPDRSFVVFQTRGPGDAPYNLFVSARLEGSDSLVLTRALPEEQGARVTAPLFVTWSVLTWRSGVRVQHGETTQAQTTAVAQVQSVVPSQTLLLVSRLPGNDSDWFNGDDAALAHLLDPTRLEFRAQANNPRQRNVWQLVEFLHPADLDARRGVEILREGELERRIDPGLPLQEPRSVVLTTIRPLAMSRAALITVGTRLEATGQLALYRADDEENLDVGWQALTFGAGIRVQSGQVGLAGGSLSTEALLARAVAPERTVAFTSLQGGAGQSMGSSNLQDTRLGDCSLTPTIAAGRVTLERAVGAGACAAHWFTLELPGSTPFAAAGPDEAPCAP